MEKFKSMLLCILIAILAVWFNNMRMEYHARLDAPKVIRMATGNVTGNYYSYGMNLAQEYSDKEREYISVVPTAGSFENIQLLDQNFCSLAIVQNDVLSSIKSDKLFETDTPITGFHQLCTLFSEECQIIVPADSPIQLITDLKGKRISVGEKNSGTLRCAEIILSACDLKLTDIEAQYLSYDEATSALKSGNLDALIITSKAPIASLSNLFKNYPVRLLSLSPAFCQHISELNHDYKFVTIPAGTYNGQTQPVNTIGTSAILVARNDISNQKEAKLKAFIEKNSPKLTSAAIGKEKIPVKRSIPVVSFNMYLTAALAVLVVFLGRYLQKKFSLLNKFCVPAPVIGGLFFAICSTILYACNIAEFQFDETLKNVSMVAFFTSIGFQVNLKKLSGGKFFSLFLLCTVILIVCQNIIATSISKLLGLSPLIGLCTGSISMIGGHGTAGAFSSILESMGLESALTISTAAATFGLFSGSLIGGPIARRLITNNNLINTVVNFNDPSESLQQKIKHSKKNNYRHAVYALALAMGFGTLVSAGLIKLGLTFPSYIGSMLVAAFLRNFCEYSIGKFALQLKEISDIGNICLSIFLGIAMITMKLWQLAALAVPLFVLLLAQVIFMALFAYFVIFRACGKDYDAAIIAAGACGFGLGATPNAMANMQALTEKYGPSIKAFIIVPLVGGMFIDFINSLVITMFINLI